MKWKTTKRISRRRKRKKRSSFKKAVSHIVCMKKDDCLEVEEIERCTAFLDVALSCGIDVFYYFIVIFPGAFEYDERPLSSVIHEVAHVLDSATARTFQPEH